MSDDEDQVAKRQKFDATDPEDDEAPEFEDEGFEDEDAEEGPDDVDGEEEEGDEDGEGSEGLEDDGIGPDGSEDEEAFDEDLEHALGELQRVQDELEKINDEASDKVLEVEQRYNEVRRPVFHERNAVIRQVREFWVTAFANHPYFAGFLTDMDKEVLVFLAELDVRDNQDVKSGYVITFKWHDNNPYFEDPELCKEFKFADDGTLSVEGQDINWLPGKNILKKMDQQDSFFKWVHDSYTLPSGVPDEIAVNIKDDLWLNPLKYFNGEVEDYSLEDQDDDDMDPEDGEGEFYDEGEEGEFEDEEEGDEEGEFEDEEGDEQAGYLEQGEGEEEEEEEGEEGEEDMANQEGDEGNDEGLEEDEGDDVEEDDEGGDE